MPSSNTASSSTTNTDNKKKGIINDLDSSNSSSSNNNVKPCCACPDTKKARDECIFKYGDETKCRDLIEAHRICMKSFGFNI